MSALTTIKSNFAIVWEDFAVADTELATVDIDLSEIAFSETAKIVALNYSKYMGYRPTAYGESTVSEGITEQQAYDTWSFVLQREQRKFLRLLNDVGVIKLPQSVYDGLFLYYWATMKELKVESAEGIYDFKTALLKRDYSTVASMISRSRISKAKCIRAATVIKLADYGKTKSRSQLRSEGLFNMRSKNELGLLNNEELKRARFAYYAETLKFLPNTPEGIKRDIAKRYEETVTAYRFVYDGSTNLFDINAEPSLSPVVKVSVTVNDEPLQLDFDFTLEGTRVNINKILNNGDIIFIKIKI